MVVGHTFELVFVFYMKGWMIPDLSIISIDVLLFYFESSGGGGGGASAVRLVRLARLSRLPPN